MVEVTTGLVVENENRYKLEMLRRNNNTLDNGAIQILEGLDMFIEDLLVKYEDEPEIPYEKLFYALKQVVGSAYEKKEVRDAVMTGIIREKGSGVCVPKRKVVEKKTDKNLSAIRLFAKNHTLAEISEHFKFSTKERCGSYLRYHHIEYKKGVYHRGDIDSIRKMAKKMRLIELAYTFGESKQSMWKLCKYHGIEYQGKKVNNGVK